MEAQDTDETSVTEDQANAKVIGVFLTVFAVLFVLSFVLGWFDNTTELLPGHANAELACIAFAVLCGVGSVCLAIFASRGKSVWYGIRLTFGFSIFGCVAVFLFTSHALNIIEGWHDFPPATTRTHSALLFISRAYQTHGKGQGWSIQTMPVWSNLDITQSDYQFMLAHRRPGDDGRDPDEISSRGYFCAKVTIQQSGDAVRVMHAGNQTLPQGTVVVCPVGLEQAHPQ